MDCPVTSIGVTICMLHTRLQHLPMPVYQTLDALHHDTRNVNEEEPDDPVYVHSWHWQNGEVGTREIPFDLFLTMFLPHLEERRDKEHEGLILRLFSGAEYSGSTLATAFLTTMRHGLTSPAAGVSASLSVDGAAVALKQTNRLSVLGRVMGASDETLGRVLAALE